VNRSKTGPILQNRYLKTGPFNNRTQKVSEKWTVRFSDVDCISRPIQQSFIGQLKLELLSSKSVYSHLTCESGSEVTDVKGYESIDLHDIETDVYWFITSGICDLALTLPSKVTINICRTQYNTSLNTRLSNGHFVSFRGRVRFLIDHDHPLSGPVFKCPLV
jgi:hypothetical protein